VFDRVNKLERNIITKHTSLVDFKKLGYFIRVFYGIKAKDKYSFLNFINDHSNVNNLCVCANNHDFFFEILFKNTSKMYDFFETLNEHCENVDTYHVIEDLKREDLFLQNHIN